MQTFNLICDNNEISPGPTWTKSTCDLLNAGYIIWTSAPSNSNIKQK